MAVEVCPYHDKLCQTMAELDEFRQEVRIGRATDQIKMLHIYEKLDDNAKQLEKVARMVQWIIGLFVVFGGGIITALIYK